MTYPQPLSSPIYDQHTIESTGRGSSVNQLKSPKYPKSTGVLQWPHAHSHIQALIDSPAANTTQRRPYPFRFGANGYQPAPL
jgi:hypothetical protein